MRHLTLALLPMILLLSPAAAQQVVVRGATPGFLQLEPGQSSARAALYGLGLEQLTGGTAYRDGLLVTDVTISLGAPSPALRDVFVSVLPTAPAGDYRIATMLGRHTVFLPLAVRVAPPKEASGRRQPEPGALDAVRRNQDAAAASRGR